MKKFEFYCLLACLFAMSTAVIWIRTITVKATYRYSQHEKDLRHLQDSLAMERVKWLKLTAQKKLDQLAATYNLHAPKYQQVLQYRPKDLNPDG
ncbi:MAG: hypothetical protein HY537_08105 [Deltaproteobacteria bacterium]|nr:hypothetical protein [Deltaproteobacteria bacterium]